MPEQEQFEAGGGGDAFSNYSNDTTRMRYLLFKEDEDVQDQEKARINSSKECNPQDDTCERKKRLSFELHPDLILEDLFAEQGHSLHRQEDQEGVSSNDDDLDILLSLLRRKHESQSTYVETKESYSSPGK